MDESTFPERPAAPSDAPVENVVGFVVAWCADEAALLGSWLPVGDGMWIFGRGTSRADDPHPRLAAVRQRPGANFPAQPFDSPSLSRVQFLCGRASALELKLENVGRRRLSVNGREATHHVVSVGDVVEIGNQLTLLVATRPRRMSGPTGGVQPFGAPDAHGFVGETPSAWKLRAAIDFAGPRPLHVLICGDSGTGKEIVARALHALSRCSGAFVSRNAATLPEALIDAELFGNADGYPNPGMRARIGLVGAADKGTLFLDEFAELPMSQQTHLLRVLDAGEYQRLGEANVRHSALRLVGATNRPLSALRHDVAARFPFTVHVPSLIERREDVPLLVRYLLQRAGREDPALASRYLDGAGEPRVSPALIRELIRRPPSGNVRGLRSALWSAIAESSGDTIELPAQWLSDNRCTGKTAEPTADEPPAATTIRTALDANGGSLERTWRALGLSSRFALMRLMKKEGLEVKRTAKSTS